MSGSGGTRRPASRAVGAAPAAAGLAADGAPHGSPRRRAVITSIFVVAVAAVAAGLATAFGFWMGSGERILKLEAALVIGTVGLAVVPLALRAEPARADGDGDGLPARPILPFAAALLSAGAALVHFAVIKQHFDEYWLYGLFFALVGPAQLAWAVLAVRRPSRALYWLGALGNSAIVVFFIVTRTAGPLIGPEAGNALPVGFGDALTTAYEALLAAIVFVSLSPLRVRPSTRATAIARDVALLSLIVMPQTALALQSAVASAPFIAHAG